MLLESGKNRAFCFPEEGEGAEVEQEVLFHGIILQRVPGDSPASGEDSSTSIYSICAAVSFLQRGSLLPLSMVCTDAD